MASSRARRQRPVVERPVRSARLALPIAVIVLAGLCTYWNSLGGPFVWDDETAIVTNASIQHLWPPWVPLQPPRETPVAGRPVVNLSFAINYAVDGLTETGYHVGNISLHIVCALLLFGVVRRTLAGPRLRERFGAAATSTALIATLLWMVHPIQSEVVDYITQRTESVMALFYLLTLYCVVRAGDSQSARGTTWQVLAVVACALGMASKESMLTAPLIVVLYDRIFGFDSWREAVAARKYLYGGLAGTYLVLGALVWQQPRSTAGLSTPISSWTYLLNQAQMIARYLWLTVWPRALVLDYGLPRPLSLGDVFPAALLVIALVVAAGVALVRWPRVGFLAAAFFVILAPTSSVIPISSEVGAERRLYLSLAALAVLVAIAGRSWVDRAGRAPSSRARPVAVGLVAVTLVLLAGRTMSRNAVYASSLSLWRNVVEQRPQGRARMALATELITAGLHDEALQELRKAVIDYPDARFGLGTELIVDGKIEEGIAVLRAFIADKPDNPNRIPARTLVGQALASQGKLTEAADHFRALLAAVPRHDSARATLADVLFSLGRYDEAATEYRAVLATQPNNSALESKLAASLLATGHPGEAIDYFQQALRREPESVPINRSLAEAYLRQNEVGPAERHAREALRLAPGDPAVHNLLAITLASSGNFNEAIPHFREALRLNPGDRQVQANLERALGVVTGRGRSAPRVAPLAAR